MRLSPLLARSPLVVARKELWARLFSRHLQIYLVNEYPKSGGTWLKNMLAEMLGIPPWTREVPHWGSCVMQAHYLRPHGLKNTVALFRDGRDVVVSYYHHSFFVNEYKNHAYVNRMRSHFQFDDYDDVRANLLPFLKMTLENPVSPGFTWVDFVVIWAEREGVVLARYEDLRSDTASELRRIVLELAGVEVAQERAGAIAEQFSMANMRSQLQKSSDLGSVQKSFIRKGSVGGWDSYFTDDALEYFEVKAGHALDILGYERGRPATAAFSEAIKS